MFDYKRPNIEVSDDLAEGVYAASGSQISWTLKSSNEGTYGSGASWEKRWYFSVPAAYDGKNVQFTVTFNGPIHKAWGNDKGSANIYGATKNANPLVYTINNFDSSSEYNYCTVQAVQSEGGSDASCNIVSATVTVLP